MLTLNEKLYQNLSLKDTTMSSTYSLSGIVASSWAVLIDLSDTVNWPHKQTGAIDLSSVSLQVDKPNATTGSLSLAVVTRVDNTSADVTIVRGLSFSNASENSLLRVANFYPFNIRCDVIDGTMPFFPTNTKILATTDVQADVALDSHRGAATVFPEVGDILIRFSHTAGTGWVGATTVFYNSHRIE